MNHSFEYRIWKCLDPIHRDPAGLAGFLDCFCVADLTSGRVDQVRAALHRVDHLLVEEVPC